VDVDPTNDQFVDDRYLVLTHGRDYDDYQHSKVSF